MITPQIVLSHVALLIPSTDKAAAHLKKFNFNLGKDEIFDGEGTKEVYVERERVNSLLLMQPFKNGAYQRAIEKRGAGLHHLAIDVLNLENYIESISNSGWLLHPKSINTIKHVRTAYLARPGFSALIEVQEKELLITEKPFVSKIQIRFDKNLMKLLEPIGCHNLIECIDVDDIILTLDDKTISFKDLI